MDRCLLPPCGWIVDPCKDARGKDRDGGQCWSSRNNVLTWKVTHQVYILNEPAFIKEKEARADVEPYGNIKFSPGTEAQGALALIYSGPSVLHAVNPDDTLCGSDTGADGLV